jgi:Fur family ferric uptake transcriptional regulator
MPPSERSERIDRIEAQCRAQGIVLTRQRRRILQVVSEASDHPDIEEVHRRVKVFCERISLSTVYRTLRTFEARDIVECHTFRDHRPRYEVTSDPHHDHLIDTQSGSVIDFHDQKIDQMQSDIARRLGFRLVGHRLELYGAPICAAGSSRIG